MIKKIELFFKASFNLMIQIIGLNLLALLAFLGINGETFKNQIKTHFNNNLVLIFLIFLCGVFFSIFVEKIIKIIKNYEQLTVKAEIERITLQKDIQNIIEAIPNRETIKIWNTMMNIRSKKWAKDAILTYQALYLDYTGGHWEIPTFQSYFYSNWKDETATFYEGKLNSESFEEHNTHYFLQIISFFDSIPNWVDLLSHAFEAVSSRINNQCHIVINSERITFSFPEGKIKKNFVFYLKKNDLDTYILEKA